MDNQEILPKPEQNNHSEGSEVVDDVNEKSSSKKVEQKSSSASGFGAVSAVALGDAQSQVSVAVNDVGGATTASSVTRIDVPESADDLDLIEKAWVRKAKEIVNATQGDPYKQNNQINKIKAEYIKKRYNKEIKFREE